MRRTIEIKREDAYYRGQELGWLNCVIQKRFGFANGNRYAVTIKEGSRYRFEYSATGYNWLIERVSDGLYMGLVCVDTFSELFFKPDGRKRYDIIVRKVKK